MQELTDRLDFTYISEWLTYPFVLGCLGVIIASWLSANMFPVIILLCRNKNLMDEPGHRKVHVQKIPNLGGVGLFVAFTLTITVMGSFMGIPQQFMPHLLALLAAVTILFFLGVKDDLMGLSPTKKFAGQAVAALLVIILTDVRIMSLEGLLGEWALPYGMSVFFTLFVFLLVINAYNLADGIDGLAGTIAVIASVSFGIYFLLNGHYFPLLVSFILIGALRGFLKFNLSKTRKVFMGDSGSLFIGYLLAYQAVAFLQFNYLSEDPFPVENAPIMTIAILAFPLMDTLRVFIIRIAQKRSPFSADRNHIHHRLLDLGLSHKSATLLIGIFSLLVIVLSVCVADLEIHVQLVLVCIIGPILLLLPYAMERNKGNLKLVKPNFNFQLKSAA